MFRRSRLSIRPNVGSTGRTAGAPQDLPLSNKDSANANSQAETPVSVTDTTSAHAQNEPTPGDSNNQSGDGPCSSAVQRRKRFSVKPKVVPGRPSALPRTPKSPIKPVLPLVKSPAPVIDKAATTIETNSTAPDQEILFKTDIISPAEDSSKDVHQPVDTGKIQPCSQVKEISPKAPVPPAIPDRETIEISEKAKTLVSKTDLTTSSQQFSLSQLLNDKSDLVRLEKARKLRQLLKEEMLKGKSKKSKPRAKEHGLDPSKMTMRDLIHYLPTCNPMSSTLEESQQENQTVTPQSPEREASPERAQKPEVQPNLLSPDLVETTATTSTAGEQEDEEEGEAEDEDALMVPQVKVAEDGTLIIDEESLTVEVQRMKGPNTIQDRDPIFERGSTTTYSSFRKGTHTKPWSTEETDMFFLAISMVGTDFTMICQLFPHRARSEIKNKFKKEERHNAWRIDKAFRERRRLDLEYFTKLLEKILEFQESKKKLKSVSHKNQTPKKRKRKTKGKKAIANLSDVEEEIEDEMSSEEQEGEKENLCNEETPASKAKRKRKDEDDHSSDPQNDKKKRKAKKKDVPDFEVAFSEDECEKTEKIDSAKNTEAKSWKPGKALNPIGHTGQTSIGPKSKATFSEGEGTSEETVEDQINKKTCSSQKSTERMSDNDSSDQETTVLMARPTRSGRISKPVQALSYPAKEETNSSDITLTSPARTTTTKAKGKVSGKRGRSGRTTQQQSAKESKKPKLITLRASQSEESDNEEEEPDVPHDDDENSTSAFVPASLCSPKPVVPEVEETMEELDILTHMPDVLGMSKNALCPDASCEQVQNESGTVEPCEHQLDLLVDVIDFLSEHTETSEDEGYNEAAQTLLAFGNLANLSQPTESQASMSDHTSKTESQCIDVESSLQLEECPLAVSQPSTTEVSPTVQLPSSHTSDLQTFTSSGELCSTQEKSPLRKGRFSKIKPKPKLGSRTTKLRTQTVVIESKRVELETTITSQPQFSEQLEPTQAVSEPSQAESRPTDDAAIVMPSSCISDKQVGYETCSIQETAMSPKLTTTPENLPLIKEETAKKQNVLCDLRTTEQTVEEMTQVYDDIATTSPLRSLEYQKDSTQPVSEQSNSKNLTLLSTPNEMPESHTSETQVSKPSDELASPSSKNPAIPRKGRLFKLKPKPNIGCASRATKFSSKSGVTSEEKRQIECGFAAIGKLQSLALSISKSVTVSCENRHQASLTFKRQGTESDPNFETSCSQEQTEPGSQSTFQTHLGHLQETCGTPSVQCAEKPPNQLKPGKSTTAEPGSMHSTQCDHSSEEEKTANARHPTSESSKLGTPQRRRWIPKVKPNLVLPPRTTRSKVEAKEKSHATVKSSSVAATSEQQTLQDTSTVPHEYKSGNVEPASSSADASKLGISMGTMDTTQQASSGLKINTTNIKPISISELKCARFDSGKSVQQPQDTVLNNTGICQNSRATCNIHLETSEISTGHPRPVDGAVEPSRFQDKAAAAQPSGGNNSQDSSIQSNVQYQNLFPSMLPDHVPADPDEPFFILSLTEIPVCPLGEAVDSAPKSCLPLPVMEAQQRNPVEPVVPPAPGIDISLSNIHIPSPEKAALRSGHICVEEYLPSTPSVDISILVEHQEKPSVRRLTLTETGDNKNSNIMNTSPTGSQIAVRCAVDTKTNRRQNLTRKAAAKEATKHTDTTQDLAQVERSIEKIENNIESTSQKESDGSSVTSKIKRKSAEKSGKKGQNRKNFASNEAKVDNSQQQTKSATVKSREVLSLDILKDSLSSTQESNQQSSLCGTSELLVSQSDSIESIEEPTNVSQYFISDVFTEVESDDCLVTGKSNNTGTGQTAATTRNKREDRKTINEPRCPLEGSIEVFEEQLPEVSVTKEETSSFTSVKIPSTFSVIETTLDLSQAGTKNTRGKASSNKKNKVPCESLKSQRKFKAALKSPEAILIDTLEETELTSSMVQPQEQRRSLRGATEFPLSKNDSDVINLLDEELTSVSQYREEDTFAGVESGSSTVTGKLNKDETGTEKAPDQTSDTTRQKRRTKASNDPPCVQHDPLAEGQPSEASVANETQKNVNLSQSHTEKTKGKEKYNRNNKATFKASGSRPQMQRTAALKSPETPHTRSAMDQPQLPLPHQSDTKESSDDEPTNVSQYFLSDVFTEVDEDLRS